jgi:hypothetical protein
VEQAGVTLAEADVPAGAVKMCYDWAV